MKNKALAVGGAFAMFLAFTAAKNLLVRPVATRVAVAVLPEKVAVYVPALLA